LIAIEIVNAIGTIGIGTEIETGIGTVTGPTETAIGIGIETGIEIGVAAIGIDGTIGTLTLGRVITPGTVISMATAGMAAAFTPTISCGLTRTMEITTVARTDMARGTDTV
jgi:predicted porin